MGSVDITDAATYGAGMSTGMSENQLASYMARVNYAYLSLIHIFTIHSIWARNGKD